MKLEFYIESIYYYPDNPIPTVVIIVRNNIENVFPHNRTIPKNRDEMRKRYNDLFLDSVKSHKTSFTIPLEEYRASGMKIGDKLEIDMKISNDEVHIR